MTIRSARHVSDFSLNPDKEKMVTLHDPLTHDAVSVVKT